MKTAGSNKTLMTFSVYDICSGVGQVIYLVISSFGYLVGLLGSFKNNSVILKDIHIK